MSAVVIAQLARLVRVLAPPLEEHLVAQDQRTVGAYA